MIEDPIPKRDEYTKDRDYNHHRRRDDREKRIRKDEKPRDYKDRDDKHKSSRKEEEPRDYKDRDDKHRSSRKEYKHNDNVRNKPVIEQVDTPEALIDKVLSNKSSIYIPPSKLKLLQDKIKDKTTTAYQRLNWLSLKKKFNGLINKANISNVTEVALEILQYNVIRGRGLIAQALLKAQTLSPIFTNVYAALVAIINSKFPQIGELILKRLILQFRKSYRRNDKATCLATTKFIAHLINQRVAHEILPLQILTLLMEHPTDDSIEIVIGFLKECGAKIKEISPKGLIFIFDQIRNILHECTVSQRTLTMMDVLFQIYKDGFKDYPVIIEELDVIKEEDQFTHLITLEEEIDPEDILNVFKFDPTFEAIESKYEEIKAEILPNSDDESSSEEEEEDEDENGTGDIADNTETNVIAFRRTIYLTIHSSLTPDECAHKLLRMDIKPGLEEELAAMILDCCAQERTYKKFFGSLADKFCKLNPTYQEIYEKIFMQSYETVHRLEAAKIKNMSKFFAALFYCDSISWKALECVKLTDPETTSSSRIFIKYIFQELAEFIGMDEMLKRLNDETMVAHFQGLFPKDDPQNMIMAINFFTTIGLGPLTDELRSLLEASKNEEKKLHQQREEQLLLEAAALEALSSSSASSDSTSEESTDEKLPSAPKAKTKKITCLTKKIKVDKRKEAKRVKKHHKRSHTHGAKEKRIAKAKKKSDKKDKKHKKK